MGGYGSPSVIGNSEHTVQTLFIFQLQTYEALKVRLLLSKIPNAAVSL